MPDRINVPTTMARSIAQHAANVLNEALAADPITIAALVNYRLLCNEALENHPTIQVTGPSKQPIVGLLGIVCGIVERQSGQKIAACFDADDKLIKFIVTP